MLAPRDETGDLRTQLQVGRWQRLHDPSLELTLLVDPTAWPTIVQSCSVQLAFYAMRPGDGRTPWGVLRTWALSLVAAERDWLDRWLDRRPDLHSITQAVLERLPHPARPAAALRLAREAVTRWPHPDLAAALDVLERWPTD
jgi:hypothetical protein